SLNHVGRPRIQLRQVDAGVEVAAVHVPLTRLHAEGASVRRRTPFVGAAVRQRRRVAERDADALAIRAAVWRTVELRAVAAVLAGVADAIAQLRAVCIRLAVVADLGQAARGRERTKNEERRPMRAPERTHPPGKTQ